jgi:hypothetical protein
MEREVAVRPAVELEHLLEGNAAHDEAVDRSEERAETQVGAGAGGSDCSIEPINGAV